MKNFSSFLKSKKARADHFTWEDGDTVTESNLEEWTADKPLVHTDWKHQKTDSDNPHKHEFMHHDHTLSKVHKEHMHYYKGDSYSTNHLLRHGKFHSEEQYRNENHAHDHIKHMDHVTSYQTKHHHTTYRGGIPSDIHKFKPGHQFQDHGYTGTSLNHHVAANFSGGAHHKNGVTKEGRKIMHVIHSPPGTKAHYVDVDQNRSLASEHEMVLHRGTKFKVTHHSHDAEYHYIHSRVVGNKHKKMPDGYPGKHYSPTNHAEHEAKENGVSITKHEDQKPHETHKIKIHITPEQQKGLDRLKAKQQAKTDDTWKKITKKESAAHAEKWKDFK
jgi:hypothetical protein